MDDKERINGNNTVDPLNALRVTAMMLVFILHAGIIHNLKIPVSEDPNELAVIFKTPAWAGVWIFIFLSGYVLGKGFYGGKYEISPVGIVSFYFRRFLRLVPSYYLFVLFAVYFYNRAYIEKNPDVLKDILLFRYDGLSGGRGLGALWYVSTIAALYILAPFIYSILGKIGSSRINAVVFVTVMLAGMAIRINSRTFAESWYSDVYIAPAANMDIFICGMMLNPFVSVKTPVKHGLNSGADRPGLSYNIALKALSGAFLIFVIYISSYFYYTNQLSVYRYFMPTVFTSVCALFVIAFDGNTDLRDSVNVRKRERLTVVNVIKNRWRIIDYLASVSFEFYLFHSCICLTVKEYANIGFSSALVEHSVFLICSMAASLIAAALCNVLSGYIQKLLLLAVSALKTVLKRLYLRIKHEDGFKLRRLYKNVKNCTQNVLAFSMALIMLFSLFFALGKSWRKESALKGKGTRYSPYLITNAEDLALFRNEVNGGISFLGKYLAQTEDIDLGAYPNWTPIGIPGTEELFCGTYDGRGHTINNLYMQKRGNSGLFGTLSGTVMNLGIESGEIKGSCCGAIASHSGSDRALIINCYSKATLNNYNRAGGIADNFNGEVANCVSLGVLKSAKVGGILSYTAKLAVNCGSDIAPLNESFDGYYMNMQTAADENKLAERMNLSLLSSSAYTLSNVSSLCRWSYSDESGICLTSEKGLRSPSEIGGGILRNAAAVIILIVSLAFVLRRGWTANGRYDARA